MEPMTATISRIKLNKAGYDSNGSYYGVGQPVFLVETCDANGKVESSAHRGLRATIALVIRRCGYRIVR